MKSGLNVNISYTVLFHVLILMSFFSKSLTQTVATDDKNAKIGDCSFKSYSDIHALKDERERIGGLVGKSFTTVKNGYYYEVGICKSLTLDDVSKTAAVIQQKRAEETVQPDVTSQMHVLGNLSETHMVLGTDWILLEYRGGEAYDSHCGKELRRSLIMITCDKTKDDNTEMIFLEEENSKSEQCFYLFEIKHKSVCPEYTDASTLSVGSILVIVFFTVLAVYILVGFLYSRFVLQHKGIEQFPNYEFWKDFGNLQADGCDLVCRSKDRRRIDGIGGLGDDQLDPIEEIRDDNLLPM